MLRLRIVKNNQLTCLGMQAYLLMSEAGAQRSSVLRNRTWIYRLRDQNNNVLEAIKGSYGLSAYIES